MIKINREIILASKSPRRKQLLNELGIKFNVVTRSVDESYPSNLKNEQVAIYLANKKAAVYDPEINSGALIIAADTTVCLNEEIINKPINFNDGVEILKKLSGKKHTVTTAVCLRWDKNVKTFHVTTEVYFRTISEDKIKFYLENFKPYDKAGAYGIQEWLGLIAIERINGSYHNVMGLPAGELYEILETLKL